MIFPSKEKKISRSAETYHATQFYLGWKSSWKRIKVFLIKIQNL